ncbi:histidine phosphatase family protein [Bacillus lacus]|uniref:Histidine phosphatase family protein n=1 Tax=Metabacillus lacus TaxID=1983721 RepID=A0A7X2M0Y5_9BACI|nr:histidine phosphatase family protein [Metabacillus lacus]
MKIGLLRHFKVTRGYPSFFITSDELREWVREYDHSEVEACEVNLKGIEWECCYASDLDRAVQTAQAIYSGQVELREELREIPLSPLFSTKMKLPLHVHLLLIRSAWYFNHPSQMETKSMVMDRINRVVEEAVQQNKNILIVGHGGVMIFMRKALIKRGFAGPSFSRAENGKLYVYEKS